MNAEAIQTGQTTVEAAKGDESGVLAADEAVFEEEPRHDAAPEPAPSPVADSVPILDDPEPDAFPSSPPAVEETGSGTAGPSLPAAPAVGGQATTGAPSAEPDGVTAGAGPAVVGLLRAKAAIDSQGRALPAGLAQALEKHEASGSPETKPEPKREPSGLEPAPAPTAELASAKLFEALDLKPEPASQPIAAAGSPPRSEIGLQAQASQPTAGPAPQTPVVHQVPMGAVPIEIGLKSLAGVNRFEIRLDPAELGRIDVRLDIGESGEVKAHLVVDRVETLALLQRDSKTLERAFEQAGLRPSDSGIDLSLRDPSGERRNGEQNGSERDRRPESRPEDGPSPDRRDAAPAPQRIVWRGSAGVDVRI